MNGSLNKSLCGLLLAALAFTESTKASFNKDVSDMRRICCKKEQCKSHRQK